jgi:ubiquitin carboxyl-terminal hydrolase 10
VVRTVSSADGGGGGARKQAAESRVQPRGLLNPGNLCFMNSILQALLGSSRFCQLLAVLRNAAPQLDAAATPTLAALAALAAEFPPLELPSDQAEQEAGRQGAEGGGNQQQQQAANASSAGRAASLTTLLLGGKPLMPVMLMDLVNNFHPLGSGSSGSTSASVVLGAGKANGTLQVGPSSCREDGRGLAAGWHVLVPSLFSLPCAECFCPSCPLFSRPEPSPPHVCLPETVRCIACT